MGICKIGIVVPLIFSYIFYPIGEFIMRPSMAGVEPTANLAGIQAAVTGGCGGLGLRTAELLAESGASVVLGCRDGEGEEAQRALASLRSASLRWSQSAGSQDESEHFCITLRMDSLDSVRDFASEYLERVGKLHLLVNNAGTRLACNTTADGIEEAFQVNYLSHFLLTKSLLPALRRSSPSRVVHAACRDGYVRSAHGWNHWFRDGWLRGWLGLPVPIAEGIRVGIASVDPKLETLEGRDDADGETGHAVVDDSEDDEDEQKENRPQRHSGFSPGDWKAGCKPEKAYANAKLALLAFSHELERRLRESPESEGVVSHVVNPNPVNTDFLQKGTPPSAQQQWSYYKVMSYFPPVWIIRKVFGAVHTQMMSAMLRSVDHGAKAIYHVGTSEALASSGGTLFDDTESPFVDCGRPAHRCGRVPRSWQPPVALDRQAGSQLWEMSEDLVRDSLR